MNDIDWNAVREEFEAEYPLEQAEEVNEPINEVEVQDEGQDTEIIEEDQIVEEDNEAIEEDFGSDSDEGDSEPVGDAPQLAGQPDQKRKQTPEENKAAAQMRHRLKEMEQYKEAIEKLAQASGVDSSLLLEQIRKNQMQQEATKQGLSVEQYEKFTGMQSRLEKLEVETKQKEYTEQIDKVRIAHGIKSENDPKILAAYEFIRSEGLYDPNTLVPTISFEKAFKVANHEALINETKNKARQEHLAMKKQRQTQAPPVVHKGGQVDSGPIDFTSMSSEEFDAFLKTRGVSLD